MENVRPIETWLTDMDGVLVHEEDPIPGATEFVEALKASGKKFLLLTNNSIFTPRDLRARLLGSGIDVPEEAIWTSALATADFLADQRPRGSAYVVGEPNPLMMRSALNRLEAHSETTVMIGDRMDTDIISGLEAGLRTVLVTTGSTRPDQIESFPYRPTRVIDSISDLVELAGQPTGEM